MVRLRQVFRIFWILIFPLHCAYVTLGLVALAHRDFAKAYENLFASAKVPNCFELWAIGPDLALAAAFVKEGESKLVYEYVCDLERLNLDQTYQYALARFKESLDIKS